MKTIKQFDIGSSVFFSMYEDYNSKDKDVLLIVDRIIGGKDCMNAKIKKDDVFLYRIMSKEEFIKSTIDSGVYMKAGKFLVPEFANWLGITIDDLRIFDDLFEHIDKKHSYETLIYKFYIENNGFWLSQTQRDLAYEEYKKSRQIE